MHGVFQPTTARPEDLDPFRLNLHSLPELRPLEDDRAAHPLGTHLQGKHIALVVTGSIAAYKAPEIARIIRGYGARVSAYLTPDASRLVSAESLRWAVGGEGRVHEGALTGNIEHLAAHDGSRFDAYLVAPATYNIINMVAQGIADDPVSTLLAGALGRLERSKTPLLFVPTMNGDMVTSPLFRSLGILENAGAFLVHPRTQNGKWELPDTHTVVLSLCRQLSKSVLAEKAILLTSGPTPVRLDKVRVITNIFRGALGETIAHELVARGSHLRLLFGGDPQRLPRHILPLTVPYRDFDGYRDAVRRAVTEGHAPGMQYSAGIFSAAVADYRPEQVYDGKIASGSGEGVTLPKLVPTPKIIDEVRTLSPTLPMITFKLLANVTEHALLEEARRRLSKFDVVIANRLEELNGKGKGESVRWIVTREGEERYCGSNAGLAVRIVDCVEKCVAGAESKSNLQKESP